MFEYNVPDRFHIKLTNDPSRLFPLCIGIIGDIASAINDTDFDSKLSDEELESLLFATNFFEAFFRSRQNPDLDPYVQALAAAAYYMCALPGSSLVFSNNLPEPNPSLGPIYLLNAILKGSHQSDNLKNFPGFGSELHKFHSLYWECFHNGLSKEELKIVSKNLLMSALNQAEPRDLLATEVSCAVAKLKISNSVWSTLATSTDVPIETWSTVFQKRNFVSELWPSQKILAEANVFRGNSATIQMPTSAGKTKSIEIALRSFFFKNSTQSAVIVAPFRALCHEISDSLRECFEGDPVKINAFTDVFQRDYSTQENMGYQIVVTTPEKLVYILRQDPLLSDSIGLIILDEGHQFDSGIRGVTFELLLTSLKQIVGSNVQWILISAVLSNADSIHAWLNGNSGSLVAGTSLSPTKKTVGFVNWVTAMGRIEYVKNPNIDQNDFFVPRVIQRTQLKRKPREKTDKFFPEKSDGGSIALHLGLNLVRNGCVAIFCGVKSTAVKTCDRLVDLISRGYESEYPRNFSNEIELDKLSNLYRAHLGTDSSEAISAELGVLSHHASIPHGLRLSVEYALREELARFVVCTSTLAQGVNLPIRYLFFTNIYQAGEKLSVRDFHNLAGRAGRSGMHTEGTIIFSNPEVYEMRNSKRDSWRWKSIRHILNPAHSEPCTSSLLSVFSKIHTQDDSLQNKRNTMDFLELLIEDKSNLEKLVSQIVNASGQSGFSEKNVRNQLRYKKKILSAIEGYLLSYLKDFEDSNNSEHEIESLAKSTLAFHLASEDQQTDLVRLFLKIGKNLKEQILDQRKRVIYSKTLLGVTELKELEAWLSANSGVLLEHYDNREELLAKLWEVILRFLPDSKIQKLTKRKASLEIVKMWVNGDSFAEIHAYLVQIDCKYKSGSQHRKLNVQFVVDICEGDISFEAMLIVGALIELVEADDDLSDTLVPNALKGIQKSLRYGLLSGDEVKLYEMGYADRVVAQSVYQIFSFQNKTVSKNSIREHNEEIKDVLRNYPSYFFYKHTSVVNESQ
ncbi:MAG: DEAD/DEAH box helicase [Oligoflexales bacterium]|nr:DEAD/DEAH box helicase [Oligoflexales bacterium]